MSDETVERVRALVAEILNLPLPEVQAGMTQAETPAWTSMNHLNLILTIEQEFNVSISPEQAEAMTTIPAIVAILDH